MSEDMTFIKDGIYLKTDNGFEEAVLYMSEDDARCFDIETSVHICLKKDFARIQEVGEIRDFPKYPIHPILYNMEYVEEMLTWDD